MPFNFEITSRRTGRTTRMLRAAIAAVEEGKAVQVYVVAAHLNHARQLEVQALSTFPGHSESIKKIRFRTWATMEKLDVGSLTMRGAGSEVKVLADHAAISNEFHGLLREYFAYDSDEKATSQTDLRGFG